MLIAHRGIHNEYIKENSYKSFTYAIESNIFDGFELDIRETLDHEFVITHDFFYKNNLISKTNYKDLEDIPLLTNILKLDTNKLI